MNRCYLLVLLLLCYNSTWCYGQENKPWSGFAIEVNASIGKMIRHSPKFPTILPDYVTNYEVNFIQQTYGRKDWHKRRNYPIVGLALAYTNYGIDSIYGKCISIYPNLQIPLITGKKIEWTLRAGFGLGFMTNKFNRYPSFDTINTAIGSTINNFSHFTTDVRYRVNENLDLQAGVNFYHVSSASFKFPNLGINAYGAHIGIRYFPVTSTPKKIKKSAKSLKNRWLIQARVGLTTREYNAPDGPAYPIYLLSLYTSKRYWSKNKLFFGVDYTYHSEVYRFLKNNEIAIGEEAKNAWRSSLFIGNEFLVGRIGILFQIGYYLKDVYLSDNSFYQKLGGNFYVVQQEQGLLKELCISALLKTHREKADIAELGIGLGF